MGTHNLSANDQYSLLLFCLGLWHNRHLWLKHLKFIAMGLPGSKASFCICLLLLSCNEINESGQLNRRPYLNIICCMWVASEYWNWNHMWWAGCHCHKFLICFHNQLKVLFCTSKTPRGIGFQYLFSYALKLRLQILLCDFSLYFFSFGGCL